MTQFTPYYKFNLLLFLLVLFVGLALVSHFFVPTFLQNILLQNLVLSPQSASYDSWQKSNIPIYSKFYLFNLTNAEQVLKGDKPTLEQIGPYTFRHTFEKVNITWNEQNDTVEYRQVKRWIFEASLSNRSLDDEIVHFNVPLMVGVLEKLFCSNSFCQSAVYQIQSAPIEEQYMAYESLNSLIEAFRMSPILRNKVRNLLFEGYHDTLLEAASNFYPTQVSQTKFGWFYGRNNTSTDGIYRIFTGQDLDHPGSKIGLIDTWNGEKSLSRWQVGEKCRSMLSTSAGDLQPPFFLQSNYHLLSYFNKAQENEPMPSLRMFIGDMCRVFELEPKRPVTYQNLPGFRYRAAPSLFNYSLPENQCYCHKQKCPPNGLYHLGICAKGSPMFVSYPHFLHSDPSLLERVRGLAPSENDHEFVFDYDKNLAIPVNVNVRLQINLLIKKVDQVEIMENWPDKFELYLPQFWSSNSASIDDSMAAQLSFLVNLLPLLILALTVVLAIVSGSLLSYVIFFAFTNQMFFGINQIAKYESVSILSSNKETKEGASDYDMHEL